MSRADGAIPASLYTVLGVAPGASDAEVRAAYRARARLVHPDAGVVGGDDSMALLNDAYATLINPVTRASYDAGLRSGSFEVSAQTMVSSPDAARGTDEEPPTASSPLSAAIAVFAALGAILAGLGFALFAPGLALFGLMLLGLAGMLSGVRFRQAVKQGRDAQR